jgi:long-chain acyl-CoA synthetase
MGLWGIAASNPDAPAVIAPDGGVVSYAELAREADRYGRGFQALGLVPGTSSRRCCPTG